MTPKTAELAAQATATVAACGALLNTLEWLSLHRLLQPAALLGWSPIPHPRGRMEKLLVWLRGYPRFIPLLLLRAGLLIALPFALWYGRGGIWLLGLLLGLELLVNTRQASSTEGSDHMMTQVFGALFLGYLGGTSWTLQACLAYLALQTCLAYFTAGVAKFASPVWRRGDTLFAILNSRTFGCETMACWLRAKPRTTKALTLGFMVFECAFPLVLVVGFPWCWAFLAGGLAFHLATAVLLGFTSFTWAFGATYPAILFLAYALRPG